MPAQKIETGHSDTIHDVAMDYYGKRVATASSDSTIKITGVSNSGTSQHLATLTGHQGPVWQAAWAHPKFGSIMASCSYDGRVILWKEGNQNEWAQAHVFSDHKSSVNSIAWAPHELGLCLACGSSDGNVSVFTARPDGGWDTTKIEQAHPVGVTSVSWAPSMAPGALVGSGLLDPVQKLASGGCDNTVKVWKLYNGTWKMDCFPALQMHNDVGLEKPTKGAVLLGEHNVLPNYFEQNQAEALDLDKTVLDTVAEAAEDWRLDDIKGLLGRCNFKADMLDRKVSFLSGGEKARLSFCKFMVTPSTLLVLDEPTNHLDIPTKEMLEEAISEYKGTVITVSHDRYFIKQIVNRVLEVKDGILQDYMGDYNYYLEKNLDARERELEREAEIQEKSPKEKANSKMSKAEREARKKQKMQAFQQAKQKSKGVKNAKRWK